MYFKVKRLACVKGNQYLFRNLSFSLIKGQLLLLKGPNGSGKSSLLQILADLTAPHRGQVEKSGEIAYLGHKDGIKRSLTVSENIQLLCLLAKHKCEPLELKRGLSNFKLIEQRDKLCQALSMGQRRKVALVALLLKEKPIWIMDEPFTGLDKESAMTLCNYLNAHIEAGGIAIVASHSQETLSATYTIELPTC